MSEEQIAEALGANNEEQVPDVVEQDQIQEEELPELTPVELAAFEQGWRPKEEFKGDESKWKSASDYITYGVLHEQIRDMKAESRRTQADNDSRIANLNKLHSAQQKAAIEDLKAQQLEAVESADTEKYKQLQSQIDNHQVEPDPVAPQKDPVIAAWEAENPWINDPSSEKAIQAQAAWTIAAGKPGATNESALAYVDAQMAKLHPSETQTNQRREAATMTENSTRRSTRQRSGKELTMSDLTRDEQNQYDKFGRDMFADQKSFLKAVSDARKEG